MMKLRPLPALDDDEKRELCLHLERLGLLRRSADGRWALTQRGHLIGSMLCAVALVEERSGDEARLQ